MPRSHASAHGEWVAAARPVAPRALTTRVTEVLAQHPEWELETLADALTKAGESLLAGVMGKGEAEQRDRATALDLLAADACVTWAFEAASDAPDTLSDRARAVTSRILSTGVAR